MGCDLSYEQLQEKLNTPSPKAAPVEIPKERQEQMIAYAKKLRAKFPHMKPDRVKKKVAEYFKVKLT